MVQLELHGVEMSLTSESVQSAALPLEGIDTRTGGGAGPTRHVLTFAQLGNCISNDQYFFDTSIPQ